MKVETCLISVSDKEGIVDFAKGISSVGIMVIASGGTAKILKESRVSVLSVEEVTGFPSILDGRVKTLHPAIHGGILAKRKKEHLDELERLSIKKIDMVVCNLYPFEERIKEGITQDEAIEEIDIGGVTLIRAGAKNYKYVCVVVNKERYKEILDILKNNDNCIPEEFSYNLATEAFNYTAHYDSTIANWFLKEEFPEVLNLSYKKVLPLRYGENPHQRASFYAKDKLPFRKISGRELSYNNILDLDSAYGLVLGFNEPACVIIKHNSPCGVSISDCICSAYKLAYNADPISAFGGIIGVNKNLDLETAEEINKIFCEAIIAPSFDEDVISLFLSKNTRLVKLESEIDKELKVRNALGGILLQDDDIKDYENLRFVTKKKPSDDELKDLLFAYKVSKYVKSNAIVIAKNKTTVGICGGQTNRVDAVKIANERAGDKAKGAALASDGFFPFPDSIYECIKGGISSIIQPGGSIKDKEVIDAADNLGISMVFANIRHFRH
ncbi:TPA: bifunctional phosphoribosylaminoimidazolecarboxamide formyltransferase/inosine monophosphate cyclohydrolase [bacterium]|nr:bifunctional phosphoribosylaminoimidazolecarboxamide formyltransferase/inosine monophosphate cyclohydrolase [bacterium]